MLDLVADRCIAWVSIERAGISVVPAAQLLFICVGQRHGLLRDDVRRGRPDQRHSGWNGCRGEDVIVISRTCRQAASFVLLNGCEGLQAGAGAAGPVRIAVADVAGAKLG